MPHRPKPKWFKKAQALVTTDNVVKVPTSVMPGDRANLVPGMDDNEIAEITTIIASRHESARQTTEDFAEKEKNWDKQYNAEWQDPSISDEAIFLPKTREQVTTVYSYIMLLVSQLNPLVTMTPMVTSIWASNEEYRRAKVKEALTDFYISDMWKLRDDVFPRWLKLFLKTSMAIWKVTYREDNFLPDLKIDVVDRALIYIDPTARDIRSAGWVIEKYFLTRSEVFQRIEEGHWHLPDVDQGGLEAGTASIPDDVLRRYYGENYQRNSSVTEDELIEVWDYWQAPTRGLQDCYAVILGGENGRLVRYGRNPFPYKGLPYRAKSFDPNEFRPDGTPLTEQYRPFQELVNNFLNMRVTDVRKNIIRPVVATGRFVDAQTQQDFADGQKIVRLSDEVLEASKDPAFDIRKHFAELPFQTSTENLLVMDLPFVLGQGKESANVSDVFRGQAPPHQATLGQVQEQLSRNQGAFRPVYLQVMRGFEELAEIVNEYFKSPEFFPAERIIQVIGKNRYADVLKDWHNPGGNMFVRSVSADEMDVDVTVNAVNGADALASRTFLMSSLEQILHGIGQVPELYNELKSELNFAKIVELMINASGQDSEAMRFTPQEKEQRAKQQKAMQAEAMQMQQMMMQMQAKMEAMTEAGKAQAKGDAQIKVDQARLSGEAAKEASLQAQAAAQELRRAITEITENFKADLALMIKEAKLERENMEAQADADAAAGIDVGHGNAIEGK